MRVPKIVVCKRSGAKGIVERVARVNDLVLLPMHAPDGQAIASLWMDAEAFDRGETPEGFVFLY